MPIRLRRAAALVLGIASAGVFVTGLAAASPTPGGRTDVTFVPITPHHLLTNAYLAAGQASSPVVMGGLTTVPTDATTVQLSVTLKGTGNGTLSYYPAGNPAAGDSFTWVKGGGQDVVAANVGASNEVSFVNHSSAGINLSVTLSGYSTQVSEGDITGSGGTPGQVLTDTGAGASWQTPGTTYVRRYARIGLPATVGGGYEGVVHVPAGSYLVQVTGTVEAFDQQPGTSAFCSVVADGYPAASARVSAGSGESSGALAMQALVVRDSIGDIGLDCNSNGSEYLVDYLISALPVGTFHDQSS